MWFSGFFFCEFRVRLREEGFERFLIWSVLGLFFLFMFYWFLGCLGFLGMGSTQCSGWLNFQYFVVLELKYILYFVEDWFLCCCCMFVLNLNFEELFFILKGEIIKMFILIVIFFCFFICFRRYDMLFVILFDFFWEYILFYVLFFFVEFGLVFF